jgi:hypothetical protein
MSGNLSRNMQLIIQTAEAFLAPTPSVPPFEALLIDQAGGYA